MSLTAEVQRSLLERLAAGSLPHSDLKERDGDCRVLRLEPEHGDSVVLKLWNRSGVTGALRRLSRTSPFHKERRALLLLAGAGVPVPAVLGATSIPGSLDLPFTHALFLEDLGNCEMALDFVKALLRDGREDAAWKFLEEVAEMTERLLAVGLVDLDHTFINIVATPSGQAARLDLELARRRLPGPCAERTVGRMLGRLIGTFAYGASGHGAIVERFALLLEARLSPGRRVLAHAWQKLDSMLERERRLKGLDVDLELPWGP